MRFLLLLFWLCLSSEAVQIASDLELSSSTIRPIEIDRENVDEDRVRRAAAPSTAPTASSVISKCANLTNDRHSLAIVHWSGQTGTQVSLMFFVLTVQRNSQQISYASTLWRSTDYGDNFVDDSAKVSNAILDYYYINGLNNKMIIFTAITAQQIYVTRDEGDSYLQVNLTFRPNVIKYSPYDENKALAYDSTNKELYASTDFAHTWTLVTTNVSNRFYWENLSFLKERIFFEKLIGNRSKIFEARPPYNATLKQFLASSTPDILFDPFSLVIMNEFMISQATDSHGSGTMYTSYRNSHFIAAQFPFRKSRKERDYLLVEASEGQLFVAVNHRSNLTSLYMSYIKGTIFSLSVDDVLTNSDQSWESRNAYVYMFKLPKIRGIYFVNQHKPDRSLTTLVTFNKGATWNPVSAPLTDLNGRDTNCFQPTCSLQMSSRGIFARSSAIGLVWAQGNVGSNLQASAGTFLSRDGGRTWRWVFDSYYQASFADQGAVMAAARVLHFTKTIQHSCDEGMSWNSYDMDTEINVRGVLTEPGEMSLAISVFGFERNNAQWKVCKLDFADIIKTPCNSSQYYRWALTDRVGRPCVLGLSVFYTRRKAEACCYNGRDYHLPVDVKICECAAEDFECDIGYERKEYDSPCVPSDGTVIPGPPKDCPENTVYYVTRGYRRVVDDHCVGGVEDYFLRQRLPCPVDPPGGLEIVVPASSLLVGRSVNFTLNQLSGGVLSTNYTWDFGDGGLIVKKRGFSKASFVSYSFAKSGSYNVKMTGVNRGGRSVTRAFVRVYDVLEKRNISVNQPSSVVEKQAAVYSVAFLGDSYGDFIFAWAWGDGNSAVTQDRVTQHAYAQAGFYNATVNVKSLMFLSESHSISFYVSVNSSTNVVVKFQVESKKKTVIVAASVSVVSVAIFVILALGVYYYKKKYGRLEVEYSQLRVRGRGNYVFGDDNDYDNTIGEEDEDEDESQNTTSPVVVMSALTDNDDE